MKRTLFRAAIPLVGLAIVLARSVPAHSGPPPLEQVDLGLLLLTPAFACGPQGVDLLAREVDDEVDVFRMICGIELFECGVEKNGVGNIDLQLLEVSDALVGKDNRDAGASGVLQKLTDVPGRDALELIDDGVAASPLAAIVPFSRGMQVGKERKLAHVATPHHGSV